MASVKPLPLPGLEGKTAFIHDLFREHSDPLVKYLTSRFRDREDAAEIAQEAWLRMYRLDKPEELRNPRAFLFQTASNLAVDRYRRDSLEQKYARTEGHDVDHTPSAEREIQGKQDLTTVYEALAELPLDCRQAFVMHRSQGLSYPQIAAEVGVSVSMVEKYIIRALKHFRQRLHET